YLGGPGEGAADEVARAGRRVPGLGSRDASPVWRPIGQGHGGGGWTARSHQDPPHAHRRALNSWLRRVPDAASSWGATRGLRYTAGLGKAVREIGVSTIHAKVRREGTVMKSPRRASPAFIGRSKS